MIDAKRVEEMKRLSEEATMGPWYADIYTVYNEEGAHIAQVEDENPFANMHFIADSRQFVPDIIVAYEEQAEEISKLRKALEFYAAEPTYSYAVDVGFGGRRLYKIDMDEGNIAREALK